MVEEHEAVVRGEQARRQALPGPSGESWPARMERLLGSDVLKIGAGQIGAAMSLRDDAGRMSDNDVRRELYWILENGYRWRPAPQPIDEAAVSRIVATMSRMRQAPGLYGGAAAVDAMCSIGEAMIERAGA